MEPYLVLHSGERHLAFRRLAYRYDRHIKTTHEGLVLSPSKVNTINIDRLFSKLNHSIAAHNLFFGYALS